MATETQTYANHGKTPTTLIAYSVLGVIGLVGAVVALYLAVTGSDDAVTALAASVIFLALGAIGGMIMARQYSLVLQDRIIRLEMQVRLARILPADMQSDIGHLTIPQLVGLRFASDGELAELVRATLQENPQKSGWIKKQVKVWQADHQRV